MIRSMTAFARLTADGRRGRWIVEIRSLNHRYFEFSLRLPGALNALETAIRDLVQSEVRRGKITVAVSQDSEEEKFKAVSLDEAVVRHYLAAIRRLKRRFRLTDDVSLADLLKLPGIFKMESLEGEPEKVWPDLKKIMQRTLLQLVKAKEAEGRRLAADIRKRLQTIAKSVARIETLSKGSAERVYKKLAERLDQLLAEKEKDPDRVHREAAFLAERSDITEEVVRMKSHLELFGSRLNGNTEAGRELDFLCQEMNREVNTMGSKAQLFDISTEVVFVKGELEKIREQIQNIE